MKGILFTEFLAFAEGELGPELADRLSEGRADYRPAATYDPRELDALIQRAAALVARPTAELLRRFGESLFGRFAALYPIFFHEADSAVGFVARLDTFVHGELLKLYDDVEFPRLQCQRPAPDRIEMTYRSPRRLADLAEGLMRGCIAYYGDAIELERTDLPGSGDEQVVRFTLVSSPTA
jgi:heme-NO-binding protein